jgi:hypothetical protein
MLLMKVDVVVDEDVDEWMMWEGRGDLGGRET